MLSPLLDSPGTPGTPLPRLHTPTTAYCPLPPVLFWVLLYPGALVGQPVSLPGFKPPNKSTHPSPLQLPRAHPESVESVLVKPSEVYLKGHLKAGEDTPLLAPARTTGSAVRGSQFFSSGGGRPPLREAGRAPAPPGEGASYPMTAPATEAPAGAPGRGGNGSREEPGCAPQGKGRSAPGLRARRAEGKRKARDGR